MSNRLGNNNSNQEQPQQEGKNSSAAPGIVYMDYSNVPSPAATLAYPITAYPSAAALQLETARLMQQQLINQQYLASLYHQQVYLTAAAGNNINVNQNTLIIPQQIAQQTKISPLDNSRYCSIIECGCYDSIKGHRVFSMFSAFFHRVVDVYTADHDPNNRILFRATMLAEKFDCATNKVGMYLVRRRCVEAGIFQATQFRGKPQGKSGLKVGAYFLSLQACQDFENHFNQQLMKKDRGNINSNNNTDPSSISSNNFPLDGEGSEVEFSSMSNASISGSISDNATHIHTQTTSAYSASNPIMDEIPFNSHTASYNNSTNANLINSYSVRFPAITPSNIINPKPKGLSPRTLEKLQKTMSQPNTQTSPGISNNTNNFNVSSAFAPRSSQR
jgi:hypothetical protein